MANLHFKSEGRKGDWREEHEQSKKDQAKIRAKNDGALFYDTPPAMRAWGKSLSVSHPEEPQEKQADQIARQVVNNENVSPITPVSTSEIQTKHAGEAPQVTPQFENKLNSSKGSGSDMPGGLRGEMEGKMNTDFSGVKLHTDSRANEMTQEMNAKAFTHGQDIYFRSGKNDFASKDNKELLAHELVHAGQENAGVNRKIMRANGDGNGGGIPEFGTTNYRFDTYKITAEDLDDPEITGRLDGLSLFGKLKYFEKVQDGEVHAYLLNQIESEVAQLDINFFWKTLQSYSAEDCNYMVTSLNNLGLYESILARTPDGIDVVAFLEGAGKLNDDLFVLTVLSLDRATALDKITKLIVVPHWNTYHNTVARLNQVRGNTSVHNRAAALSAGGSDAAEGLEILISIASLPLDRQKVVLFALMRENTYDAWRGSVSTGDQATFSAELTVIDGIAKEFKDPLYNIIEEPEEEQFQKIEKILYPIEGEFLPTVEGRSYKDDINEKLTHNIAYLEERAIKIKGTGMKYEWSEIDRIGEVAKKQVDKLYGFAYNVSGPALKSAGKGGNLQDLDLQPVKPKDISALLYYIIWLTKEQAPRYEDRTIHQAHNAIANGLEERIIVDEVINDWLKRPGMAEKLAFIEQLWPGEADPSKGIVYIQLFIPAAEHPENPEEAELARRKGLWKNFIVMMHEYLHTITHKKFAKVAKGYGGEQYAILYEGGTSYFTDQVWKTIYPDEIRANDELRMAVEGKAYPFDPRVFPNIEQEHYAQIKQVREMVAVLGEENFRAAYFKGKMSSIGL